MVSASVQATSTALVQYTERPDREQPGRIVGVSCEPAPLARDLAILREGGYTLRSVQPLDSLPQTYHVELVSLLTL